MIKKNIEISRAIFLLLQLFLLLYLMITLENYTTNILILLLIVSCIGLFIVSFSVINIPSNKKQKIIPFVIFCLSIISITLSLLLKVVQYIITSMP